MEKCTLLFFCLAFVFIAGCNAQSFPEISGTPFTEVKSAAITEPVQQEKDIYAADLTGVCTFGASSDVIRLNLAFDREMSTAWEPEKKEKQYYEISYNGKKTPGGLYVQWLSEAPAWELYRYNEQGEWESIYTSLNGFINEYIPLPDGSRKLRIEADNRPGKVCLSEISLYSVGKLPEDVQTWQKPEGKVDLMLVSCHPDDEFIFMGGTLPYYAGQLGKKTEVVYMTHRADKRTREALNGLWTVGVRDYPVFGRFTDSRTETLEEAIKNWKEEKVFEFLIKQIRRFKPAVVVSHDLNGEYGHGAHKLTAQVLLDAVQKSMDPNVDSVSAQDYGTWQVKKFYSHLYKQNTIRMDWKQPLDKFSGKTALDSAKIGFEYHKSQQKAQWEVLDGGNYDCSEFGLLYSTVGLDRTGNDFFENIIK